MRVGKAADLKPDETMSPEKWVPTLPLTSTRRERAIQPNQFLAWAYCRVSTLKTEQGLSLEEQLTWAKTYCRENGLKLVTYCERASAKNINGRKIFVEMMSALVATPRTERPSILLATSADRFARDMGDAILAERALREAGVQLFLKEFGGPLPTHTFAGQATLVAMSMGSQAENEARSNRAKASWERRRREGKPMSNKSPYGIQLRNERDTASPGSAVWVKKAFQWYANGVGMPTIAVRLKEGAPPHRVASTRVGPDGKPIMRESQPVWEPNRVKKLLVQKRYRGTVVPADLFDRVQELLERKPRYSNARCYEYPLSGAIPCSKCGRHFHGNSTGASKTKMLADGTMRHYVYEKRVRAYTCTVCRYRINADFLEASFRNSIVNLQADHGLLQTWLHQKEKNVDTAALEAEIRTLEKRVDPEVLNTLRNRAWALALRAGPHAQADLERQLALITLEERHNRERLSALRGIASNHREHTRTLKKAHYLVEHFWDLYDRASYVQKRTLIGGIVNALGGATGSKTGIKWNRM